MLPMVKAQNLKKIFHHQNLEQVVFENLAFEIQRSEFVTFLGPSGCGKSTLLRILGGLEKTSSGVLQVESKTNSFVFQEPRLLEWRNCLENTLLPLEFEKGRTQSEDQERARKLLAQLGLKEAEKKYPHQLSGGMKMRNAVARSLILSPDFLLFDEPFAALDETTRNYLQAELRSLYEKNQWSVAFVTHSIEEACFLSDRIFIFSKNRNQLIEHRSRLPQNRSPKLRSEILFFEEVKSVRQLFETEALK